MNKSKYQEAQDWAYDRYHVQGLWLRRSLFGLIITTVLLGMSLIANLTLIPLKEKVPYLYAFDQVSGEVSKIGKLEPTTLSGNWELTRYLLMHYAMNREGYDIDNLNIPYQMVWAQSAEHVRVQYEETVQSNNKQSPYQLYGKDKYITVRVLSVNQLNDNTVDMKFAKTLHDRASGSEKIIQKEAIIKWEYTQAETTQKMLDRDPLGFKVTYYQATQVNIDQHEEK